MSKKISFAIATILAAAAMPQAPALSQEAEPARLDDIVVTAQRREETLQKAAIAVSAVAGDVLTSRSISDPTEVTQLVPALQVTRGSAHTQFYLRGVGTFGANAFAEQGIGVNLDGVYLSRLAAPAALFYDIERIEVLKGPQGTLYGRNATGGTVNIITARPQLGETSGFINAEFGDYDALKASAALNLASGERSAWRFAGQYVSRDGYFSDGYDDEDSRAARMQFRFDNGAGFDLNVMIDHAHVGGQGSGGTIVPLVGGSRRLGPSDPAVLAAYLARPPAPPVPQIIARDDGYQNNNLTGIIATANVDLGFARLTVIPAWRETNLDFVGYASSFLIDVLERSEQRSLELRLANDGERLKWVAGAYWFDEDIEARQFFDQSSNSTRIDSELDTESVAVFGQATLSFSDRLRGTAGVRYTSDDKSQDTANVSRPFVGFVPPGPPAFIPIILTITSNPQTDVDFTKTTWKAGLELDLGPDSLLYASVATGFKSGILYSAVGQNYSNPEELTAFSIGSKNRFLGDTLQLNLEAFYWDYTDQQISHLGPVQVAMTPGGPLYGPVFLTENAGGATIWGLETELLWQPTRRDLLSLNVQYLNTEYDELRYQAYSTSGAPPAVGCPATLTALTGTSPAARIYDVDCSGQPLPQAPEWTVNAAWEHRFELGNGSQVILGVDSRIETERYLSLDFMADARQGSSTISNARVTWEAAGGAWSVTAFVNNIEDDIVFSNSLQSPVKGGTIYNQ
ncbi:MAG: TonB-dependent receptor, partial [Gammaproteobacteria bacterium]